MPFKKLYAAGAIGFCMTAGPLFAQTADLSSEDGALFVPIVAECVEVQDETTCGQVRGVVTECAADLDRALCDVLFVDPDDVFDTPLQDRAEELLSETSEAIAGMTFEDVHNGQINGIVEEGRADAERTLLRGDENKMSHSGPPVVAEE